MDISKIDKNFEVKTKIGEKDIKFYNSEEEPFRIYGVFKENGMFRRMPEMVAKSVSEGVFWQHTNTAGGRVKFRTNSNYVAIHAKMPGVGKMPHFALTGSAGFDIYADGRYAKSFMPPFDITDGYESIMYFPDNEMRDITINMPLYSNVSELWIGVQDTAEVKSGSEYVNKKPVVYYGSSITQGGCASRPGTSYESIVSRRFNCDYVNLGFSGNAKAEDEMIEYIKSLDMSIFVYDYDHNAPTIEHLEATHQKMFEAIRKEHPELPVIMMSRPKHYLTEDEEKRLQIIENTYNTAVANGDKNVYLINGKMLTELCGNEGTVDDCHPTDFGFASMAKAVGDVIYNNELSSALY